ncbi:MAG TPA: NAD(P)/FAD-dependent oxidoreductase [Phycisphaerae bacterium]|nr:NAD(P)/FAD-dependent oxidoreductase [Phycisphaerae bacterium]
MPSKTPKQSEVIVIGAGPAGSTAALLLAREGRQVLLLDSASFPRPKACAGWLSPRGVDLCGQLGIDASKMGATPITEARFLSADLSQSAQPSHQDRLGVVVDRTKFDEQMALAAKKAGAKFHDRFTVSTIRPGESEVEVESVEGNVLTSKLVILATGVSQRLSGQLGLHMPTDSAVVQAAHVTVRMKPSEGANRSRLTAVLAAKGDGCCLAIEQPDHISLTLHARAGRDELTGHLVELAERLHRIGFLSMDVSEQAARPVCAPAYRFNALDADSHVGKRSLVIGDAGGFYATVSLEGIFPAMWSAQIAATIVDKALAAPHPQDALMGFDREWRLAMADFLRPPNTDLHLLVPLIFTNQPMADRMGAAFFLGENI